MKIAILTHPLGKNYGGIMQAYALQKLLINLGHSPITIDLKADDSNLLYRSARLLRRFSHKLTGNRKAPINIAKHFSFLTRKNQAFINHNIYQSQRITKSSNLYQHFYEEEYDAVIVGSDQTWRPKYVSNIYDYYLDFLKNKDIRRIAYATSFGVDNWEYSKSQTKKCSQLAQLFDCISVRESSGVELCSKYLKVHSTFVLDPTLLLEKNDYLKLINCKDVASQSKGVFTYFLDSSAVKTEAANHVASILNTFIFKTQARCSLSDLQCSKNISDYEMPSVSTWLTSFYNSEFVLTDSFHGMLFSIIFDKPFLVIINQERGAARFHSLLKQLDALDVLIEDPKLINSFTNQDILRSKTINKSNLNELKKISLDFIKNSLS